MKKWNVYGLATVTIHIGVYEAETQEEAIEKAEEDEDADWMPSLCWQCSEKIDLSDVNEIGATLQE